MKKTILPSTAGKPKGKAKYPHNSERPVPIAIRRALDANDIPALEKALTPRQRAFAREYIVDFNGKAAAIRAGYASTYADRQAHLLLQHDGVRVYIDHLTQSKVSKIQSIDPDYVLQRITEIVNKEEAKDGDKLRGLELLARHLGMLTDKQEITGKDGGAIELAQRTEEDASAVVRSLRRMGNKPGLKVVGED